MKVEWSVTGIWISAWLATKGMVWKLVLLWGYKMIFSACAQLKIHTTDAANTIMLMDWISILTWILHALGFLPSQYLLSCYLTPMTLTLESSASTIWALALDWRRGWNMYNFPNISFELIGSIECKLRIWTLEMRKSICPLELLGMDKTYWECLINIPAKKLHLPRCWYGSKSGC